MKKVVLGILCALSMCLAATAALADSWDFLHSVIRLTASLDVQRLADENGLTLSQSEEIEQHDFLISGLTIAGLLPKEAIATKSPYAPFYDCQLSFDGEVGSTAKDPGQVFTTLLDSLTEKYGTPNRDFPQKTIRSVNWEYQEGSISLTWWAMNKPSNVPSILLEYSPWHQMRENDSFPPFPYTVTSYAAEAFEEHTRPYIFRNNIQGGMQMEQVIAAEGKQPSSKDDNSLIYEDVSINGHDTKLIYWFEGPMDEDENEVHGERWLTFAQVLFKDEHSDLDQYTADYRVVQKELLEAFGPDGFGDEKWYVPWMYNYDESSSERALCYSWTAQDAVIAHLLEVRDDKVLHGVLYTFYGWSNCAPDIDVLYWPDDACP